MTAGPSLTTPAADARREGVGLGRVVALVVAGLALVLIAGEFAFLVPYVDSQHAIGTDLVFYRHVGEHWLDTGEFYSARQLAGPYIVEPDVDNLYPPIAIPFLAMLRWLPFPLWWAIPIGIVVFLFWRWRPAVWAIPIVLLLLAWPRNVSDLIYGNSNMWVIAAVAAGLAIGWPAVFVFLKPSLAPFALVGAWHRSWWIAVAIVAVWSVLLLSLWREYLTAIGNSDAEWYYSLEDAIPMSAPIVAWLARRDGGFRSLRELVAWRPTRATFPILARLPGARA